MCGIKELILNENQNPTCSKGSGNLWRLEIRRTKFATKRFGEPLEVGNKANKVRYKKVRGTFGGWK
ncbi:hypothetical protein D2A30_10395 [Streptococcus suis]|nr:hypothetical protein D2A30_10395 [Streptococcus suis]